MKREVFLEFKSGLNLKKRKSKMGQLQLQRLTDLHRLVIIMHMGGEKNVAIAKRTGLTASTITNIITSDLGKQLINKMQKIQDAKMSDTLGEYHVIVMESTPFIRDAILEGRIPITVRDPVTGEDVLKYQEVDPKTRISTYLSLGERVGLGAVRNVNITGNVGHVVTSSLLDEIKGTAFDVVKKNAVDAVVEEE